MKKIMLLALVALFGISMNVQAVDIEWVSGKTTTKDNIQYTVKTFYKTPANANQRNTVSVKANNFTAAALVIQGTIELDIEVTKDNNGAAYTGKATFIVNEIEEEGFAGIQSITSVSLPAEIETIGAKAFEGCENLSEVTLAANSKLNTVGAGAFAWTSITTLDLSSATEYDNDLTSPTSKQGMVAFGGALTSGTHKTNAMIEEVKLPNTCVTISASAFVGCTALTTVDMKAVKIIQADAFKGCAALTAATIGTAPLAEFAAGEGISILANAFTGCTALKTVELGDLIAASINANAFAAIAAVDPVLGATHKTAAEVEAAAGIIGDEYTVGNWVKQGAADDYLEVTTAKVDAAAAAGIETLKYNAVKGVQGTPFAALKTIKEVYFQKYIATASAIPAASFDVQTDGFNLTKIHYDFTEALGATVVCPFAANAFGAAATPRKATLSCPDAFFIHANGFASNPEVLNGVTIGASSDEIIGNKDKQLVKDANSSNYYYYYKAVGGARSIAKKQESGATVTVYSAYIDVVDHEANIYFQPLRVVGGKYVVGAGKVVIVKSNQIDGVVAENGGTSTMDATIADNLKMPGEAVSALTVKTGADYLNSGAKSLWFFNNPANGFGFTKYDATKQKGLSANAVYMICDDPAAAGRLNIVWLDEAGNTTAIQKIENKAQADDAIYNLAGQKVSASYKGVVIKNGKKFIQK